MTTTIVGIDPGRSGGLCFIGEAITLVPMPDDLRATADLFRQRQFSSMHVYSEKPQSMPGNRAGAMLTYGIGFGGLLGIITAFEIPFTLVTPKQWQKEAYVGTVATLGSKDRARQAAQRLFPKLTFKATPRCTKDHDGMIDALLIAWWGSQRHAS